MRSSFLIVLIASIVFSGAHWYVRTMAVCPAPLHYRLGMYDDRFELSREAVTTIMQEAAAAWETAAGRPLFVYDEQATFPIDFVFDERQEQALTEEKLRGALDQKELANNETLKAITQLNERYEKLKTTYESEVRAYEVKLGSYNKRVNEANAAGGADGELFATLAREQQALAAAGKKLDATAATLGELVLEINQASERGNVLINEYNRSVGTYNQQFAEAGAFTQGEFTGDRITIYKYTNADELRKVITHELGHALGINHVEDTKAIMYYLLEEQPATLTITPADTTALTSVCGDGTELSHRLRQTIRSVLAFINLS